MTNEIQYTLDWNIKPRGLEAFKGIANKAIK